MLREKYEFAYGYTTICDLETRFILAIERNREVRNLGNALVLLNLKPFNNRLSRIVMNPRPPKNGKPVKYKFHVKRTEAIAIHLAYQRGLIPTDHFAISEIFTDIDRTL